MPLQLEMPGNISPHPKGILADHLRSLLEGVFASADLEHDCFHRAHRQAHRSVLF
jgi:hypothetical protein